jgi:hypothetical protein
MLVVSSSNIDGTQLLTFDRIRLWVLTGTECFMLRRRRFHNAHLQWKLTGRPISQDVLEREVEALCCKLKGRGLETRWGEWISFNIPNPFSSTRPCCAIIYCIYLFSSAVHIYIFNSKLYLCSEFYYLQGLSINPNDMYPEVSLD